jgi:cyclophilin family peptidyl-prolyl cis-trans isomerase
MLLLSLSDGNGASSCFFWVQPDKSQSPAERNSIPAIQRLNSRYSLFAHVVEGNDVLDLLRPGDVLLRYDGMG